MPYLCCPCSGKIYGIPWRFNRVLQFDPETKAIELLGEFTTTNYSWHGGALAKDGRIIAVPYNSAWVLEIGVKMKQFMQHFEVTPPISADGKRPRSGEAVCSIYEPPKTIDSPPIHRTWFESIPRSEAFTASAQMPKLELTPAIKRSSDAVATSVPHKGALLTSQPQVLSRSLPVPSTTMQVRYPYASLLL